MSLPPSTSGPDDRDDAGRDPLASALGGFINKFATAAAGDAGQLLRAAQRGDVAAVQAMLDRGVSPNLRNDSGETALHAAARADRAAVIALLLARGADAQVLIKDKPNTTPLHEAVNFGASDAAEELLRHGAYRPEAPGAAITLLQRAAEKGKTRILTALLQAGADPFLPTASGATALSAALAAKQHESVMTLLAAPAVVAALNTPLPVEEDTGRTPFHAAVMRGDAAVIAAMLDAGALLHAPMANGMTPLLLAIDRGEPEILRLLLARGADAHRAVIGRPPQLAQLQPVPLMYLCARRNMAEIARTDMLKQLVAAGADPNAMDPESGEYPLHQLLSSHNIYAAMQALLQAGALPERRNRRGATPLILSVERASIHEMTNLLAAGVNPDAPHGQDGRTALMVAAVLGQTERMTELLQAGADPRALDRAGRCVMDYVADNPRMASLTRPIVEAALAKPPKAKAPPAPKTAGPGAA